MCETSKVSRPIPSVILECKGRFYVSSHFVSIAFGVCTLEFRILSMRAMLASPASVSLDEIDTPRFDVGQTIPNVIRCVSTFGDDRGDQFEIAEMLNG